MGKEIKVACQGAASLNPKDLIHFQGNLKSLANSDYNRMKKQILELGFSEPVVVWQNKKKHYIINGHQRIRTVKRMIEEGYQCPEVPVVFVEAKDANEAKRKVLSLTSQFGKMENDGLYEFLQDSNIQSDELFESFRFPEIDIPKFTEEYFVERAGDDLDLATMDLDEGIDTPTPDQVEDLDSAPGQTAHVKMVQLFFDTETHPPFMAHCMALAGEFDTENITDTIQKVVEFCHETLCVQKDGERDQDSPR